MHLYSHGHEIVVGFGHEFALLPSCSEDVNAMVPEEKVIIYKSFDEISLLIQYKMQICRFGSAGNFKKLKV